MLRSLICPPFLQHPYSSSTWLFPGQREIGCLWSRSNIPWLSTGNHLLRWSDRWSCRVPRDTKSMNRRASHRIPLDSEWILCNIPRLLSGCTCLERGSESVAIRSADLLHSLTQITSGLNESSVEIERSMTAVLAQIQCARVECVHELSI